MTHPTETRITVEYLKRVAKRMKKETGITHAEALDKAAQAAGFKNYTLAKRALDKIASDRVSQVDV